MIDRETVERIRERIAAIKQLLREHDEPDYYDGEWHEWGGGDCPVGPHIEVEVEFRSGRIRSGTASYWSICWLHYNTGGDIIRFRVVNPNAHFTKGEATVESKHPKSDLLREIADAMDENPDGWWLDLQYVKPGQGLFSIISEDQFWGLFLDEYEFRRKPRTVTLSGEVDKEVIERLKLLVEVGNKQLPYNNDMAYLTKDQLKDIEVLLKAAENSND